MIGKVTVFFENSAISHQSLLPRCIDYRSHGKIPAVKISGIHPGHNIGNANRSPGIYYIEFLQKAWVFLKEQAASESHVVPAGKNLSENKVKIITYFLQVAAANFKDRICCLADIRSYGSIVHDSIDHAINTD